MREGHATIQSRNGSTVPLTLFGLTKTFTCVQLSNTYLSATLTTATFPTAAACRGFDASACTPTPRDLLSSHWQLRLHLIWKVANPLYIDVRLVAHGQVHWFTLSGRCTCPSTLPEPYDSRKKPLPSVSLS